MSRTARLTALAAALLLAGCGGKPTPAPDRHELIRRQEADFQAKLDAGRAALAAERFDDAVAAFDAALRVAPANDTAAALLDQAKDGKRKKLVATGRAALAAKQYDQAVTAFADALEMARDDAVLALHTDAVRQVWKRAGAEVGWMKVTSRGVTFSLEFLPESFVPDPNRAYEYYPAFKFRTWKPGVLAGLPVPDVSFGLDLSFTGFGDADVAGLAPLKGVYILDVTGTGLTAAGRETLRRTITIRWMSI